MAKQPDLVLFHIKHAIEGIKRHTAGKSLADYSKDEVIARAVERWVEIISEASRSIPDELKLAHAAIDWRAVADIGNVLRHDYDHVRDEIIWKVVTVHLDSLLVAVVEMAAARGIDLDPSIYRD